MAAWMTVYYRKPFAGVSADSLLAALEASDLYIAAEACGLDDEEAAVEAIRPYLTVEDIGDNRGPLFRVYYRPRNLRQVDVHLWTDPEVVAEELDEADEWLEELDEKVRKAVLRRLKKVVAVVAVEIGWTQLGDRDMGVVLGSEVAMHLAQEADGVLRDWDDSWWVITRGGQFKQVS